MPYIKEKKAKNQEQLSYFCAYLYFNLTIDE